MKDKKKPYKNNNKNKNTRGKYDSKHKNPAHASNDEKREKIRGEGGYDSMSTNDIGWYNKMTNLFSRATQIPFNRILGDTMSEPDLTFNNYTSNSPWLRRSLPLIMKISYAPGIGVCTDYNDAPNRAFQAMYSALLTKTSTSVLPFTAANLGLYTVSAQSIAQNIGVAKRLIETARVYTPDNYGLPRAFLAAQMDEIDLGHGWSDGVEDLINNIGKYEWELNNAIRDFNSLRIPNFIDTFKRQYLLAHSYFMDNDTVASQAYVFMPETYFQFSDLGIETSAGVFDGIACALSNSMDASTFPKLLDIIRTQISSLRSSKDFTSINGTLKRAFEESDFVHIDELVGNETPNFVVDDVMSYQIHNLTICDINPEDVNNITADYERDIIVYNPYSYGSNGLCASHNFLLNSFENSVSPDWIMESTRLITVEGDDHSIYACGTEIVTRVSIIMIDYDEQGNADGVDVMVLRDSIFDYDGAGDSPGDMDEELCYVLPALEKFHKGPRFAVYGITEVPADNDFGFSEEKTLITITGDLHFYTFASRDAIKRLHDTALLSIFDTTTAMNVK